MSPARQRRMTRPPGPALVRTLLLILAAASSAIAQEESVIHLEHADSLVGAVLNGEQVRQLIGNVKFKQGKMTVLCKRAIQYLKTDRIGFEGEAEFYDG